jgi:hypothetical protein
VHPLIFFLENMMDGVVDLFQKLHMICQVVFYRVRSRTSKENNLAQSSYITFAFCRIEEILAEPTVD